MPLQEEFEQQGNFLFKHRSYIPILILLASFIIYTISIRDGKDPFGNGIIYLSLGVSIIGLLIRIYTVGHSPANTSGRNTAAGQVADTLNQQGIYSIVRHPLYLGNFLMYLGFALLPMSIFFVIIFCLLFWIYYERIMFAEEQFLRGKFNTMY
ncbi:MAG: isoprenylcysteine carboxylmethyltransferase family protein, partial [Saprospiraceae bacterium]